MLDMQCVYLSFTDFTDQYLFLNTLQGEQWETLRFTIEVCTFMILWLIAHYCAIAGTILIFRFLKICLAHVGPAVRGLDPLFDPFCMWGNDVFMNISQIKKLRKIVKIKKLATKNNKLFVCTMKKTSVTIGWYYRFYLVFFPLWQYNFSKQNLCISLFVVLSKAVHQWVCLKPPVWSRGKEGIHTTPTV